MRTRLLVAACLALAHGSSHASIEWPVLYATRAVEFTEALVRECNSSFPDGAGGRRAAFIGWKSRNQAVATSAREFNIDRISKQDPKLDLKVMERDLDELQRSALSQASKARESWEDMCRKMNQWLMNEESDVERQVPDFMFSTEKK